MIKINRVDRLKKQNSVFYEDLRENEAFIMNDNETLRIKTNKGHISFENNGKNCTQYKESDFESARVIIIEAEINWCRKESTQ